MKYVHLIALLLLLCFSVKAQESTSNEEKIFSLGATVGANAIFPVINSLSVDNTDLENVYLQYKVGLLASFFCRINMDRFFIQPSISWRRSEAEIHFNIPQSIPLSASELETDILQTARLALDEQSLNMPIMIGYSIIKQGPYSLSFMAGPTLKYNYKVSYTSESTDAAHEFISESTPYGISIGMGVGVRIRQLFFDFCYEFGLNQTESDFKSKDPEIPIISNEIRIDKRTNVLSFSLGLLF